MGPIAQLFGGGSPPPLQLPPPPAAPSKLDVSGAEKKRLRRGRLSRPTVKTGPLGLGDAESKAATILGG